MSRLAELYEAEQRLYAEKHPRSVELHGLARECFPGGDTRTTTYFPPFPLYVSEGFGCRVLDVDGNELLDFLNNYLSLIHGHAHPRVMEQVAAQLARGTAYGAPSSAQIQLAMELKGRVPSCQKIRFCNSGTEAVMLAVRAARAFTGRRVIIKMEGGYHGSYDGVQVSVRPSLEAAGPAWRPDSVPEGPGIPPEVLKSCVVVPFGDADVLRRRVGEVGSDLACILVEPVMGSAGQIVAPREFLHEARRLADSSGALLVFDEVMSFRFSYGGAQEIFQILPDLTVFGKIIGGGFPIGAVGGRTDVMAVFSPENKVFVEHGGTYNANPVSMVAGLATLEDLTLEAYARLGVLGERLRQGLSEVVREAGCRAEVNGIGSVCNIHWSATPVTDYRTAAKGEKAIAWYVHLAMINRGVLSARRGLLSVSTPMSEGEVDAAINVFRDVVVELAPVVRDEFPHLAL